MSDKLHFAVNIIQPCPPHTWGHAPTVGYFHCQKCNERVEHDDPRYAQMLSALMPVAETYSCQSCRQHDECQAEHGTSGPMSTGCADWKAASTADQSAQSDEVVTQEDREAATKLVSYEPWHAPTLSGENDTHVVVQAFARHRLASTATLQASLDEVRAENARLREELAELRGVTTNNEGLLSCPECDSLSGPHLYWWQRGQAWIVICRECKHEEGRESHEYQARDIWNKAAHAALEEQRDADPA